MHTLYTVYSFGIAFTDRKYAILLRIRSHLKLKKKAYGYESNERFRVEMFSTCFFKFEICGKRVN